MAAIVRKVALDPVVIGPFLWALTRAPASIREPLLARLSIILSAQNVARLIRALKWVLTLGVASKVNRRLNQWALNNWNRKSQTARWKWNSEIAVVTGGSSGIGLETTRLLMRKGIKVAVLDVNPLPKELEGCKCARHKAGRTAKLTVPKTQTSSTSTATSRRPNRSKRLPPRCARSTASRAS